MNIQFSIGPEYVLGPALAALAAVVAVRANRSVPGWTGQHAVLRILTGVYAAAVLAVTVFPLDVTWGEYANRMPWTNQINPVPLVTIDPTAVPNVIMLIPFGFLLPLLTRVTGARRVTAVTALASLSIEAAQLLSYVAFNNGRASDINDLLVNTLGGAIGYGLLRAALEVPSAASWLRSVALPGSGVGARRSAGTAAV
ncbi:VanZ family protein [Streptomyces sp. NPDC054932]